MDNAEALGVQLLTEEQYPEYQLRGEFDLKASCWVKTSAGVQGLRGALCGERRHQQVCFFGGNRSQSYFAIRGLRAGIRSDFQAVVVRSFWNPQIEKSDRD
jgi:hypothetical protein